MLSAEAQLRSLEESSGISRPPFEGALADPLWSPDASPGGPVLRLSSADAHGDGEPRGRREADPGAEARARSLGPRWGSASPRRARPGGHGGEAHGGAADASGMRGLALRGGGDGRERALRSPEEVRKATEGLLQGLSAGDAARVAEELRRGADLQARIGEERVIHIAVRIACRTGDTRALERLLRSPGGRAALKSVNAFGETPLHEAAASGSRKVVHLLLRHGASPLARDRAGRTPQMLAHAGGHGQVAEELCKRVLRSPGAGAADRRDALSHLSEAGRKRVSRHVLQAEAGVASDRGEGRSL